MADMEFRAYRRHKDDQYAAGKIWTHYPKTNDTLLYIRVRADAGMPPLVRNDPCPLTFDAVELCQTRLGLFIVLNRLDRDQSAPLWEASNACRSTPAGGEKAVEHPTIKGYSIYGKDVDLATLPDEGALVAWIDAFKDAAENALSVNFSELPDA